MKQRNRVKGARRGSRDDGDANDDNQHDDRHLRCNVIATTELTLHRIAWVDPNREQEDHRCR